MANKNSGNKNSGAQGSTKTKTPYTNERNNTTSNNLRKPAPPTEQK
jgi:hypothetical protein